MAFGSSLPYRRCTYALVALSLAMALCALSGCAETLDVQGASASGALSHTSDKGAFDDVDDFSQAESSSELSDTSSGSFADSANYIDPEELRAHMNISEDYRSGFVHGSKGSEFQKYIVLHDTESESSASEVISYWDGNGNLVASHFIINSDGSIVQCVPLDAIAHHAGFGDAGNNERYGVTDESRDDRAGTQPIGDAYPDYGMNSYSVGIELVHVGESGWYPEEQLRALDELIAYIDAYYGFESQIIDHKAWRSSNSDTSEEFSGFLANYQDHRTHDDVR